MKNNDFTRILALVETKFGRGSSGNWKNRDFEDLNFEIIKKTKTNISAHTLKRIFGKIKTDDYYLPQKATIVALKQYVNFDESEKIKAEISTKATHTDTIPKQLNRNRKNNTLLLSIITIVLIIISISIYFIVAKKTNSITFGEIKILSTEGRIPTTVQFEYSTPNNTDSFSICYDGNYCPIPVLNGKKMKSNYYYQYPGLHRVRMWKKEEIVSATIPVYVQTKGWEVFGRYNYQKQLERFYNINTSNCYQNNIFHPSKEIIHKVGLDTTRLTEITLNNYHPTGIIGDNFILETTLKNSDKWPGNTCSSVYLFIVGKKESIQLQFANPGCSYWIICRLSEKKMDKRNENLVNFTFDMAKWQHFHIVNTNKHIRISVNNIERFSSSYKESIGEILGVTLRFQGNGYMKNYLLSDNKGQAIFSFPEVTK